MLWVKRQTAPYADSVNITDFSKSWRNGLGFCALMHRYRSDAFDFNSLDPKNAHANMELALSTAERCMYTSLCLPASIHLKPLLCQ